MKVELSWQEGTDTLELASSTAVSRLGLLDLEMWDNGFLLGSRWHYAAHSSDSRRRELTAVVGQDGSGKEMERSNVHHLDGQ